MAVPGDKTTFAPELTAAYRRIWTAVDEAMYANEHALVLNYGRHVTLAGIALLAKARKSAAAVLRLAEAGYGEDALIVTRSLVNLTIDLAYIANDPALSDDRARDWYARGLAVQAVPEPASLWLVGAGLMGLLGYGWRRRPRAT